MKISYNVRQSVDFVFEYLTDMQKFVSIHPVITKIKPTGDNTYLVYETLRMGFIPISFTYPVTIESKPAEQTVIIRATVKRMAKIEMTFVLKESGDFTLVEETIQFKSRLPIRSMMQRIFKKQHAQLFKNMEQVEFANKNVPLVK